jgi:hypothetical protein
LCRKIDEFALILKAKREKGEGGGGGGASMPISPELVVACVDLTRNLVLV